MVEDRGFFGRLPMPMQVRRNIGDHGWQDKTEPESASYYSRLCDGNYRRISGIHDGLPDVIQGNDIITMKQRSLNWNGSLPNRIFVRDVEYMQRITGVLPNGDVWRNSFNVPMDEYSINRRKEISDALNNTENNTIIIDDAHLVDEAFHNNTDGLEELRQHFANNPCERHKEVDMDKGTARRMKRLETENKYYKDKYKEYQQMYIGAGQKIKELKAEVERLKQFEPIITDPNVSKNKSDIIRRFETMDVV